MENKHTQQVDFSNPNADKITSAVTNTPIIKLTAVEWLISELELDSNSYLIEEVIKRAKAMEKEQIINAIDSQYNYDSWLKELPTLGEQYYNETYKK